MVTSIILQITQKHNPTSKHTLTTLNVCSLLTPFQLRFSHLQDSKDYISTEYDGSVSPYSNDGYGSSFLKDNDYYSSSAENYGYAGYNQGGYSHSVYYGENTSGDSKGDDAGEKWKKPKDLGNGDFWNSYFWFAFLCLFVFIPM